MARPGLNQVVPKYHDTEQEGSNHHQEKKSGVRFIVLPSSHDKSMPYSMRNVKVDSMREIEQSYRCGRFWYASENYIDCNAVDKRIKVIELVPGLLWEFTSFSSLRFLSTFLHQFYHIWVFIDWGEQLYDFILSVLPFLPPTVVYIDREHCVSGHTFYREAL